MSDRIQQLQEFLDKDPSDSFIRYALAQEYGKMGKIYQSIAAYEELKADDPDYVGLYYHLGMMYQEVEEPDKALAVYAEGISIAKKIPDFHALGELNTAKVNLEMEL